MPAPTGRLVEPNTIFTQLEERGLNLDEMPGVMFHHSVVYIDQLASSEDLDLDFARQIVRFAGGKVIDELDDLNITQIVVGHDRSRLKQLRQTTSRSTESR
jgi:ABC-type arginine transport system ATPase subunit